MSDKKLNPIERCIKWMKDVEYERKMKKRYKQRVKELKKKDPHTYD